MEGLDYVREMYEAYSNELFKIAKHYTQNDEDAKDIIQNVFIKLSQYDGSFDSEKGCKMWLIRVTINESKNLLKKWWTRNVLNDNFESTMYDNLIISEDMVYGFLDSNVKNILNSINSMKDSYKEPLLLMVYGYSYKEIAIKLKLNDSTLRTRVERAKKQLRDMLIEIDDGSIKMLYY